MNTFKKIFVWVLIFSFFAPYLDYPQTAEAQTAFSVQVVGTTNTQAVLSYTSPSVNACKIEVSESASYSPLVHDVNSNLFSGADLDSRSGSINSGTTRIVVIGKRMAERSVNGNVYSRALQAYTTHYYRITCGANTSTGSFTTKNIPLGMTYSDIPQIDQNVPGGHLIPTIGDEPVIDQYTGAYIKRVTNETPQPFLNFSGGTHMCGEEYIGPQNGILCAFSGDKGSYGHLYYIIPNTGEIRHLGYLTSPAGFIVYPSLLADQSDTMIVANLGKVYKGTYSGSYNKVDFKTPAQMSWSVIIENLNDLMAQSNPNFDKTKFGCHTNPRYMTYAHIRCLRGNQDSYAWWGVYDFSQNKIIATKYMMEDPRMRWCGDHGSVTTVNTYWVNFVPQVLKGPETNFGHGPFKLTLVGDINNTQTTIRVSGEPASIVEGIISPAQVGDVFRLNLPGNIYEDVKIVNKISATEWEVQRAALRPFVARSFPTGTSLSANCPLLIDGLQGYWNPFTDEFIAEGKLGFGHSDWAENLRLTAVSGYKFVKGPIIENLLTDPEVLADTVNFAGVFGLGYGNGTAKHPSYHQAIAPISEQNWFIDMMPYNGGGLYSNNPGLSPVSGQLYKYIFASVYKQKLNRKQLPTLASSGGKGLRDVSGPNSVISDSSAHSYTYCVAQKAGECRPESQSGDTYLNIPGTLEFNYCRGGDGPGPNVVDGCMTDMPTYAQSITQFGMGANTLGTPAGQSAYGAAYSRVLTKALGGVENIPTVAKALTDGSWIFFNTFDQNTTQFNNLMMMKVPPTPPLDGINRSTFIPVNISITPPSGQGITNAVVYFGYNENSAPGNYYCTSRNEACVAVSSSINESDPFKFAQAESYAGVSCTTSCTVTVPVLPMRTAYFQVKYLNSSGQVVANGNSGVIAERAIALSSGVIVSPTTPPANPVPTPTPVPTPPPVTDETPPTISSVTTSNITSNGATVTWTTNEPATSQVQYGLTTAYGAISVKDQTLSLDHTMIFSNLTPGTTYNFRVISEDVYGNSKNSFNYTFTTKTVSTNNQTTPGQTGDTTSGKFPEWSHKKTLTINKSQISGSHADFPVLVSFSDADLKSVSSGGKVAKSDGSDILFTSVDDSKLAYEIEKYDPSSGYLIAWVKVPNVSSTVDATLKIYFGNQNASDQQNRTAVWDNGYKGVWHMNEDPSGSAPQFLDSTSNANNQTVSGTLVSSVNGIINNAVHFPSTGQYNGKGATSGSAIDVGGQVVTVSAWVKYHNIYTTNSSFAGVGYGAYGQQAARLQFSGPSDPKFQFHVYQKDIGSKTAVGATIPSSGDWYNVVGTYNGSNLSIYVNGVEDGTIDTNINISSAADIFRVNSFNNTFSNTVLDEIRISKSYRSADWIKTEYNNQSKPSSFVSVGGTEQNLIATKPTEPANTTPEQTNLPPKVTPQNVSVASPASSGGGVLPKPPILGTQNLPDKVMIQSNTGSGPINLSRDLVFGARGSDVTTLQTTLVSLGYLSSDSATGYFGPLTLSAIKKYQQDKGLAGPGDRGWGNVGPQTRAHFAKLSGTQQTTNTLTPTQKAAIQAQINSLLTLVTKLMVQLQALQGR